MLHSGVCSGACRLTDLARTSTGRGTRRRGNPVRTGASSGSVRLSDQGSKGAFGRRRKDRAGSRPQACGASAPRRKGTGSGSMNDDEAQSSTDRHRTGAARIQRTISGACPADAEAKALNLKGQVPTRTWRGDDEFRFAGACRPLAQFWRPVRRDDRSGQRSHQLDPDCLTGFRTHP